MSKKSDNNSLDRVLEINEFIKTIDAMAFLIKLNALNALFLAIRSGEQLRGYIVVTDEFNKFSEELMRFVDTLLVKIHEIVILISELIKQDHRLRLYEKVINEGNMNSMLIVREFVNEHAMKIDSIHSNMKINLDAISMILLRHEKLILRGDMLAMQAKIEGVYSTSSREVFMDVAENFQQHIAKIRESLQHLKKMLRSRDRTN